jgi:hypothetical protein
LSAAWAAVQNLALLLQRSGGVEEAAKLLQRSAEAGFGPAYTEIGKALLPSVGSALHAKVPPPPPPN